MDRTKIKDQFGQFGRRREYGADDDRTTSRQMKKSRRMCAAAAVLFAFAAAFALTTAVYRMDAKAQSDLQRRLSEEVLRFHVLANSDSREDQALKLKVRDKVLEFLEANMADEQHMTEDETVMWIREHINEIEDVIGIEAQDAPQISAKTGLNVDQVLEQIVNKVPAPAGDVDAPLKALIFDSVYDPYKGVIVFCRVKDGRVKKGTRIHMMATGFTTEVVEVGYFGAGQFIPCDELTAGMVGYITASIKNVRDTRVGDTVTDADNPCAEALPGYKKVNPMVYCGLYPADGAKYGDLRDALEKLQLNDASLYYEPETSVALGFGFRCGFLGLLHLEIIQERLEREYNLDLVTTAPSVIYKVYKTNGEIIELTNPTNLPDPSEIEYMEEPMVKAEIMVTTEFIGAIMDLCQERRGQYEGMEYMEETRALLKYRLPLNEIIYDFFDALKSRSRGYASLDYELDGYERSELVKLDILVNKEEVDALSFIVHADTAYERGRKMCEKLKDEIPRQLFEIPIQAAIGSKVIARETVRAMRKDVLAKCYGGDISRKKKLLEKQKEGKKRMRQVGNVEIPQKAFMSVLKLDDK